jgi:hypothetical protein
MGECAVVFRPEVQEDQPGLLGQHMTVDQPRNLASSTPFRGAQTDSTLGLRSGYSRSYPLAAARPASLRR